MYTVNLQCNDSSNASKMIRLAEHIIDKNNVPIIMIINQKILGLKINTKLN